MNPRSTPRANDRPPGSWGGSQAIEAQMDRNASYGQGEGSYLLQSPTSFMANNPWTASRQWSHRPGEISALNTVNGGQYWDPSSAQISQSLRSGPSYQDHPSMSSEADGVLVHACGYPQSSDNGGLTYASRFSQFGTNKGANYDGGSAPSGPSGYIDYTGKIPQSGVQSVAATGATVRILPSNRGIPPSSLSTPAHTYPQTGIPEQPQGQYAGLNLPPQDIIHARTYPRLDSSNPFGLGVPHAREAHGPKPPPIGHGTSLSGCAKINARSVNPIGRPVLPSTQGSWSMSAHPNTFAQNSSRGSQSGAPNAQTIRGRRHGPLSDRVKHHAKRVREVGACEGCHKKRIKVRSREVWIHPNSQPLTLTSVNTYSMRIAPTKLRACNRLRAFPMRNHQ